MDYLTKCPNTGDLVKHKGNRPFLSANWLTGWLRIEFVEKSDMKKQKKLKAMLEACIPAVFESSTEDPEEEEEQVEELLDVEPQESEPELQESELELESELDSEEDEEVENGLQMLSKQEMEVFQQLKKREAKEISKIFKQRKEWEAKLEQHIRDLQEMLTELEQKCKKSNEELLQGVTDRLRRIFLDNIAEEEESLCSVCWTLESNIVTIECGHGACLSCLQKKSSLPFCCKRCWEFSQLKSVQADIAMNPEGEGICELHREDQKLYCENEKTLLCVTCSKSEDHENHMHWPIAVAAVGYRKMLQIEMKMLDYSAKKIQEFQCQEKKKSLAWAVMWSDDRDIGRKIFEEKMQVIWEYLKKEKTEEEKVETAKIEDLVMGIDNEKLIKFFQKLQQMEVIQEHDIMEKRKEWEDMTSRYVRFLRDKITILEEKTQKTNVELLKVRLIDPHKASSELLKTCDSLSFFEDKKGTIIILPDSGKTYAVYINGNLQANSIRLKAFLMKTSSQEYVYTRNVTSWTTTFEK
ncbi:nestin-like [Sarcophilus harrisii]|uniref:nestin-like n=1 Tax=Sarcophilus harrisii TaxID=9305 RepID=UPI001301EADC|nr:nestin-like [Sarcophilus harrisii]